MGETQPRGIFLHKTGTYSFIRYIIEHLLFARQLGNISEQNTLIGQFFRVTGTEEQNQQGARKHSRL